ncbi:hypothetical protein [Lentilactobacillus otakiensis]|uniref:hypothetical protein n=1 Tax=Lentilactobacillus otakiensis TaxID=481720 RepID=UPI001F400D44|nr:hypothetical protein [Lentilactobacillus otakiensis]
MEQKYSEVEAEKHFENNRLWFRRFQTTRSFRKLTKPERAAAGYITQAFIGLAYKYQLRSPRRYSAKSVKEVVLDLFPEKIAATNVFLRRLSQSCTAILSFWVFNIKSVTRKH